jgi:catechol-2,3-dioxygenase
MPVSELGHLVLYVQSAERSAEFYRDVLGWEQIVPAKGTPVVGAAAFSGGRTHHELLLIEVGRSAARIPEGRRLGLYHFGLKVGESDDELREMRDKVIAAGAKIVGSSDHTVTHSLYVEDPDGNEVELYVDVPGVNWRSDKDLIMSPIRPLVL